MSKQTETQAETQALVADPIEALTARVLALETTLAELQAKLEPRKTEAKEMTDEDARNVLFGDLKDVKHKDAAAKLGLSYGQVYSCRLEFTFKHIHKEMKANSIANGWVKA